MQYELEDNLESMLTLQRTYKSGTSATLQSSPCGPVKMIEVINNALLQVMEAYVNRPRTDIAHRSKLRLCKKMGEKDVNPMFRLPREVMMQLEDKLSAKELPCLVEDQLIDEFHQELVHKRGQRQDDESSAESTVRKPDSKQSTVEKTASNSIVKCQGESVLMNG